MNEDLSVVIGRNEERSLGKLIPRRLISKMIVNDSQALAEDGTGSVKSPTRFQALSI